jgi:hypothetical protein
MASFPIIEITDGTTTVSLLEPFLKLEAWRPAIAQAKGGGTFQSSPLADGRRLVNRRFDNVIETFDLSASATIQNSWAHQYQELERLLEKATEYWTTAWQNTPVYLIAKTPCETEKRYALIYNYSLPDINQVFRAPFASKTPGMSALSLSVERGHWLADIPGDETCVEISGTGAEGHETSDIFYPVLNTDDGNYDVTTGTLTTLGNTIFMGNAIANIEFDGIYRFQNVTIPQGSIITSALIRFESAAADVGVPALLIKYEFDSNPATLSTVADYLSRTIVIGPAWVPGAWILGGFYNTPSLVSQVQTLVDLTDWESGNSMLFVVEDNSSPVGIHREAYSVNGGVGAPAELQITYISAEDAGRAATCNAEVFIANKHNYKGLTHIWYDDGGVFSANLLGTAFPQTLLPAIPAVGDVLYFGIEDGPVSSQTGGGPFFSLVFDLITAQTGVTFGNGWEFWNGAWAALTIVDNTDTGGRPLDTTGVNSVHWQEEAAWVPNAINGVTAYWVRLLVTAVPGPLQAPAQQNRDIYTVLWPRVETDAAQVQGDIAALLRALLDNQARYSADADISRVIMSLRSNSRGLEFTPYLNCSDQQEIPRIDVSIIGGGGATIGNNALAPTERAGNWVSGGVVAMGGRWRWTFQDFSSVQLAPTLQWYGSYHAFARVEQTAGTAGHIALQLTIDIGDQTYNSSGSPATVQDVGFPEIVDLGRIDIPHGTGSLTTGEKLQTLLIEIHASALGNATIDFYDLILMPADEMLIDAQIQTNKLDGGAVQADDVLSIDSVVYPKAPIRSLVRASDGQISSLWRTKGTLAFLQANEDQRLWFLLMTWDTSATDGWAGRFSMGARMQAFNNWRYLSLRGER